MLPEIIFYWFIKPCLKIAVISMIYFANKINVNKKKIMKYLTSDSFLQQIQKTNE